jgi:ribosome-associated protein
MKIDVIDEIHFSTARSGGKGGQNVNKVETMVEGRWDVKNSALFDAKEKKQIAEKLSRKITASGLLLIKSQAKRTQLENKEQVVKKINSLIEKALEKKKSRIATKPSKAAKAARIEEKKIKSEIKEGRKKLKPGNI